MPKLIVYVKADTWRRVEAGYGQDAPALMRDVSVKAIEELTERVNRDEGRENGGAQRVRQDESSQGSKLPSSPVPRSASSSSDPHFKPDPKGRVT